MEELLSQFDPRFLPAVLPASVLVRFCVGEIKRLGGCEGNLCQTLAYTCALSITGVVCWAMGIFIPWRMTGPDVIGWLMTTVIAGAGAIGLHETLTDRNDPPEKDETTHG